MAKKEKEPSMNSVDKLNANINDLLSSENRALGGNNRNSELFNIQNQYNSLIQKDYQGTRSSKDPNQSTYDYLANAIIGIRGNDYKSDKNLFQKSGKITGNKAQDDFLKSQRLDKLFTMGDTQISNYFLSSSTDVARIYDEIDSVCAYFYQLEEGMMVIRDNVLRAEQIGEDISFDIEFKGVSEEEASDYTNIVRKAFDYQNIGIKIRDHVALNAIKYGEYYTMIIPYSEIGHKLISLNKVAGFDGYPYYESTDTHRLFADDSSIDSCMESFTSLMESNNNESSHDTETTLLETIKYNLKNIYVCEDTSIPDIEGLSSHKNLSSGVLSAIDKAMKSGANDVNKKSSKLKLNVTTNVGKEEKEPSKGKTTTTNQSSQNIGSVFNNKNWKNMTDEKGNDKSTKDDQSNNPTNTHRNGEFVSLTNITPDELKHSDDMLGCYIKLVDRREMHPIKIFDFVIGYYYLENYDHTKMNMTVTDIMSNQMNMNGYDSAIDNIVDAVLNNLEYGDILKGDNQLRSMILNCILYAEKRDNPIRIKFVRPDFVVPWKTNLNEHDEGKPVALRSLIYARLYTSLMLFYASAIISKSTDTEFYYLKESALDGQANNQISDLMDQLEDSNIDPIQIANGNILHGNRAINKRFYVNMGQSEIKPFEMDVVSGSNFDMHSEFMNDLKKMAIGSMSVSSLMVEMVDEVEYASMLGMMNIKHLTRCNSIQKDFNPSFTQLAKLIIKYCFPNTIPEHILDTLEITLRSSKVVQNNITANQVNDATSVAESLTKTYVGGDNTNPPEITAFIIEEMQKELTMDALPSAPWEKMPEMYERALLTARQNALRNKAIESSKSDSE